ncbi:uncharacterized protein [Clinocottus analis]|uniref:uncharacterized protein n=1 Tax=Clinocottus analis TaxID=304258 RepID=UPI0035BFC9BC
MTQESAGCRIKRPEAAEPQHRGRASTRSLHYFGLFAAVFGQSTLHHLHPPHPPTTMLALSVSLVLGCLLTLTSAASAHVNTTEMLMRHSGRCEYERRMSHPLIGTFVPQCDEYGNFLPQQCSGSTGYCWCVDTITGKKIPNTITPPGMSPVDCSSEHYCPSHWYRFQNQCFGFMDSKKTWTEAEGYCLFEGANLASVHSAEENLFLQGLTREDTHDFPMTWIGGHDAIYAGLWMWTDGSKFNYENWAEGYMPNDMKNCLKMNYGYQKQWINAGCNYTLPFICAKTISLL